MLRPQVFIHYQNMFGPGAWQESDRYDSISLSWSLGWGHYEIDQGPAFFHTGHDFGWQNYTVTFHDAGIGVVFLSNSDNFESIARELAVATIGDAHSPFDWLGYPRFDPNRSMEPPAEPIAIEVDAELLREYTGSYRLSARRSWTVRLRDDQLQASTDGRDWASMFPETPNRFFIEGEDFRVIFIRNDGGVVSGIELAFGEIKVAGERVLQEPR
jgi:hypothetical protein